MLGIVLPFFSATCATEPDSLLLNDSTANLPFQITFITPMGTNGTLSPKMTSHISLNVVAGYNGGVQGIEVGGFANVLEYDMQGGQFAGFANVVRGDMKGIQAAGFSNYVHGSADGLMAAGFTNHSNKSSLALQAAGFSNQCLGSSVGAQCAGFVNFAKDSVTGLQAAGFANYSGDKTLALQAAGFGNVAKGDLDGAQVAGFGNTSVGDVRGVQAAGFGNACNDLTGAQFSGFINFANKVNGSQVGFINIADSFEQGAPIGFLSFVKNGYRNYSLGVNEIGWAEFQFRTGTERFHNVFAVALNPIPNSSSWAFGYGIGSKVLDTDKSDVIIDLVAYQVQEKKLFTNTYNALYRISAKYEYHSKANRFAIWGGPSLNLHQSAYQTFDGNAFKSKLSPYTILEDKGTYVHSKFWVGAQVGVSF
ncbi:hypothetical protein N8911_01890 [bacterium]|nr:hypothetical protein [bacterium]MDC1221979.1 hypothetical protein [Salibacteraceae bacterium]